MAWFDGTFECTESNLKKEFPVEIVNDIRLSEDGKKLAIINRFEDDTPFSELADPHAEREAGDCLVFYHVFVGKEAESANRAVDKFLSVSDKNDGERISLIRKEKDNMFMYSYGHISEKLLREQETLRERLADYLPKEENVFILPLKRYLFKCPVCGCRTLTYRGCWEICSECHWEDEVGDDEDCHSSANGEYTIRKYRKEYLRFGKGNTEDTWWLPDGDPYEDDEEE